MPSKAIVPAIAVQVPVTASQAQLIVIILLITTTKPGKTRVMKQKNKNILLLQSNNSLRLFSTHSQLMNSGKEKNHKRCSRKKSISFS